MRLRRTERRAGDPSGFTLIEFMVALTVFAIGVLGIAVTFMNGTRHIGASGDQTVGVEIAQQGLENLLAEAFDSVNLDPGSHSDPGNPIQAAYLRSWTVEDAVPFVGCKRITVSVRWPGESPVHMVTLVGITAQTGH